MSVQNSSAFCLKMSIFFQLLVEICVMQSAKYKSRYNANKQKQCMSQESVIKQELLKHILCFWPRIYNMSSIAVCSYKKQGVCKAGVDCISNINPLSRASKAAV